MEITPDKRKLVNLVEQAHDGKLCIPNFQRDFVWPREQVADLVRSVLRRYFVGSLLLLRCNPHAPPFSPVPLKGAKPSLTKPRPELLVLDGQQRLTALLYALTAPDLPLKDSAKRRWFFVDLERLCANPDDDEIIFNRTEKELDGMLAPETQYERRVLPCTFLMGNFARWRDGFEDWLRANQPDQLNDYRDRLRESWLEAVDNFKSFLVPLVELPMVEEADEDAIGRVCAIFEKLNSTGVPLSVYDLLTARLYSSKIRVHGLWDDSCKRHKLLREWSNGKADTHGFGVLVLRTLALLRNLDPKPRALINLKAENFADDWHRAAAAIEQALELLTFTGRDGFGVFNKKWLPGYGLIPAMAALRNEIETRKLGERPREDLRRWYWCNVFLERYSSSVETKSRRDYAEMMAHWIDGKEPPSIFAEARARIGAPGFAVRDSASFASSVYCGVFCLLAIRGARDWRRGEDIQLQKLEDHHIFPKAFLKRHGVTDRTAINSVVNRTLISDETNRQIVDDAPAEYIQRTSIFPSGPSPELLGPHFIEDDLIAKLKQVTELLEDSDVERAYEDFRAAREAEMIVDIRRVCGVAAPATEVLADGARPSRAVPVPV